MCITVNGFNLIATINNIEDDHTSSYSMNTNIQRMILNTLKIRANFKNKNATSDIRSRSA